VARACSHMRYLIIFEQADEDAPREALVSTGNERVIAECVDVIVRRLGTRLPVRSPRPLRPVRTPDVPGEGDPGGR
jgi:hypothetical protein